MCGIVGYAGREEAVPILLRGLERLEYRGYDSSGVACVSPGGDSTRLALVKEKGKLARLKEKLNGRTLSGCVGIGHTRWATHGEPSEENAHPHQDCSKKFALVHNGIIENYADLKQELLRRGHRFVSGTDTEVAAHLIEENYKGDVLEAFRRSLNRMRGFFAFAMVTSYEPGCVFVFKRSNPLVIGVGRGENLVASDVPAILPYTHRIIYLDDDEVAKVSAREILVYRLKGNAPVRKEIAEIHWNIRQAEKEGYPHFMLKEIFEQPRVVETILKSRLKVPGDVFFDSIDGTAEKRLRRVKKVHFVSCGTAYHAGLVGNYMLGDSVRLPVEATVSSEFRYENPVVDKNDLVILITQSGETADTIAALREAKSKKAFTLALVNVVGSTISREADCVIYTHAGPEIGVASTKAYLAQLTVLALLSIYLGKLRGTMSRSDGRELGRWLVKLPRQISETLKQDSAIRRCARALHKKRNFLYLGRGYNFPNALEGALKLKEITYAHAHGYPAGEMKHGPIALIDSNQPVICLAPQSKTYDKMLSNIEEIKARRGIVISVVTAGDKRVERLSDYLFYVPPTHEMFSPILTAVPLQLLAYHVAVLNKRDVDQPRNLAKSVTVE
jgi:glucosamine--fructose-6-phosphate aminotransferase (isomerizing)